MSGSCDRFTARLFHRPPGNSRFAVLFCLSPNGTNLQRSADGIFKLNIAVSNQNIARATVGYAHQSSLILRLQNETVESLWS